MREEILSKLLQKNEKAVWAFDLPQVATKTCIDITKSTNAEVCTSLYKKFECVWLFESPVNFYYNWKQIVLSGLKLLSESGGFLVIKTYNTKIAQEKEVLQFLTQFFVEATELQNYVEGNRGYKVSIFEVKKLSNLPDNEDFKGKEGKISNFLIIFYKILHKIKL